MKKLLNAFLLAAFAVCSLSMSSCKKDDDSGTTPTSKVAFTATIDGAAWTSTTTGATYRYGVFVLSGKSSTGASIILRVKPFAGNEMISPYMMFQGSTDNVGIYMESSVDSLAYATNQYTSKPGDESMLTFSKFDAGTKTVSGTFTIKVKRLLDNKTKAITGTFTDIVYDDKIPPTPGKTMTAKVNGTTWTAASVVGTYSSFTSSVLITGNASNGTTIGLNIPTTATAGQTLTPSAFGSVRAQYNPTSSTYKTADSGSITITEHDKDAKVMKGTFNFVAVDPMGGGTSDNITAGSFVVVY